MQDPLFDQVAGEIQPHVVGFKTTPLDLTSRLHLIQFPPIEIDVVGSQIQLPPDTAGFHV